MFTKRDVRELFRIDRFKAVYYVIAIATAQHTAWGAATSMQGSQPADAWGWWVQGLFFAIGIDLSMVMVATKIRNGGSGGTILAIKRLRLSINFYMVAFAVVALFSTYFQLVYAWAHAEPLHTAGGIAPEWTERLQGLIDARIVIAPLALPLIATLYTIGGFGKGGEAQSKARPVAMSRTPSVGVQSIRIEQEPPLQLQGSPPRNALPAPKELRSNDGRLNAYICPGCGKQLSISGWSRHKKSCKEYQQIELVNFSTNGHAKGGE